MRLLLLSVFLLGSLAHAEGQVDLVLVEKAKRTLSLYEKNVLIAQYPIALGGNPVGHKECQGDNRTPEGEYSISGRNKTSAYHLSLRVSYPNAADRAKAKAKGCSPGGDIMIHGLPNGFGAIGAAHRLRDWTAGCVAVTNTEIEEIWRQVPDGTRVVIRP